MPKERVTMRKIREILRLAWSCGQSRSSIAKSCGVGKTTVSDTLSRALAAKLSWPLPHDMGDDTLENLLYRSRNIPYKLSRVRRPKDKPKVEVGVQIVQRFILAGLRHRTFFSLAEANAAISERLEMLNNRPFRKLPGTRKSRFEELDRPAMLPLPETPYEYADWIKARVHIDYHVEVDGHFYSVPHRLVREQVEVRYTETTVECFFNRKRVASHRKSSLKGKHTTCPEHMPKAHREFAEWTPERFITWAGRTGPATARAVEDILSRRAYPEHGFRSCMGIISLGKRFGQDRLEAACERALLIKGVNYRSIKSILENNLDKNPSPRKPELTSVTHENIRGTDYYN